MKVIDTFLMENGITITDKKRDVKIYKMFEWLWESTHPFKCRKCKKHCMGMDDHAMLFWDVLKPDGITQDFDTK